MVVLKLLASWVGWRLVPNYAADHLLPIFHRAYPTFFRRPPPPPGSPLWQQHRKYLWTLLVFGYAIYTFRQAANAIGPNLYEILGIPPTADEAAMKSSFRSFAKLWHPDKAGPQAEAYFMEVRTAYEALKNPVTRFAYDRFGPQALKWEKVTTMQDYFMHGMGHSVLYYAVSIAALLFWNKIMPRSLAFWNYILLFWTFAMELLFIMAPSTTDSTPTTIPSTLYTPPDAPARSSILGVLWPNRVAYQHIAFLKSLSILLSAALYQVVPTLFPSAAENLDPKIILQFLAQCTGALQGIDREAFTMIHTNLHACHGESTNTPPSDAEFPSLTPCDPVAEPVMDIIREEIETVLTEALLRGQPGEVHRAAEAAIIKRRRLEAAKTPADPVSRPSQSSSRRAPPRPLEVRGSAEESKYVRGRSLSL